MRLAHEYPHLAKLSCEECQRFIYSIPDGIPETFEGADGPEKMPRGNIPTPCDRCPKGGPENDQLYRLSWKNFRTLTLYKRIKSGVVSIPAHLESDPLLADNFAIIDDVMAEAEANKQSRQMVDALTIALMRVKHG